MPITIVGAGAIGGVVGGYLARSGQQVLLVDTVREHVDAINAHGLFIDGLRGEFRVQVPAVTPDKMPDRLDLVFLCVKAQNTPAAMEPIVPRLGPDSAVVSLQNGMNERVISEMIGANRTIGAFMNWGADYHGPGHVRFGAEGAFYMGELDGPITPRVENIVSMLQVLMPVKATDNIWGYLWSKECLGSILFATAMINADVMDILADDTRKRTLIAMAREAIVAAHAMGYRLEPFDMFYPELMDPEHPERLPEALKSLDTLGATYWNQVKRRTGVWRDLAVRKRPTEVDYLTGAMVEEGEAIGFKFPLNRKLIDMIHEIERDERPLAWENLGELEAMARTTQPELFA